MKFKIEIEIEADDADGAFFELAKKTSDVNEIDEISDNNPPDSVWGKHVGFKISKEEIK